MALIKQVEIKKYKTTASYWKVGMFSIDTNLKETCFSFNLYMEKTEEKDAFIDTYTVTDLMGLEDKTLYNKYFGDNGSAYKDWQTACYEYAKEHVEFFKDAVDDPEELLRRAK